MSSLLGDSSAASLEAEELPQEEAARRIAHLERRLQEILRDVARDLRADAVTLLLYDFEDDVFDLPVQHGLRDPESFTDRASVPGTDRLAGRIVRERTPIFAEEIRRYPELNVPLARREGIAAVAAVPLTADGEIPLGVLFVSYHAAQTFSAEAKEAILGWAKMAVAEVERSSPFPALRRLRPACLSETDETLRSIAKLACSVIDMPTAIWLPAEGGLDDPRTAKLKIRAATGLTYAYRTSAVARRGDGSIIDQVLGTGEATAIPDLSSDPRFPYSDLAREARWQSMLVLPIRFRGENWGALQVFNLEPDDFEFNEYESLRRLAEMASIALENARRSAESEELARLAEKLSSKPDFELALQEISDSARRLTGADSATIILVEKQTGRFVVSRRSPPDSLPTVAPRARHGLTQEILETGDSVRIDDTQADERVNPELVATGIRSNLGVRLELKGRRFGVLYAEGKRSAQFGERELRLLQTVADQASVALGWTQLLIEPWSIIEQATENLDRFDGALEAFAADLHDEVGFDFCSLQLVRRDKRIIEMMHATGLARGWLGRSRHYLHEDPDLRDVQADIVLSESLRTEVLKGFDPRFDEGIFTEFGHQNLIRVFSPLVVVRTRGGALVHDWFERAPWCRIRHQSRGDDERTVYEAQLPRMTGDRCANDGELEKEVIGTVEVGYESCDHEIPEKEVKALVAFIARNAHRIYSCMLRCVEETIITQARHIVGAESASLHFLYDDLSQRYLHEVRSGVDSSFLDRIPPSSDGLGARAIRDREAKFIPDPALGHDSAALERLRPDLVQEGFRAMAAFPFYVGKEGGVLYLHFHRPHKFGKEEIGWVQLFTNRACDVIRHVTAYTQLRDRARQLETLQIVGQYLVSNLEESDLLRSIAWSSINTLAADVVTIYEYRARENRWFIPPRIAGRMLHDAEMHSEIGHFDAPARLVESGRNVFVDISPEGDDVLNCPDRERPENQVPPFVVRERIKSSAGVLLKVREEVVGVMFVNYRRLHHFSHEDKRIIEALASAAAIAINNQRLHRQRQENLMEIGHNLRKPLQAVSGHLSFLRNKLSVSEKMHPGDTVAVPVEIYEDLKLAHGFVEDLNDMSQSMFTSFAREAGKEIMSNARAIDVKSEVERLCQRMQMTQSRSDLEFVYDFGTDFPKIHFDRNTFHIVMYNLIQNAMTYAFEKTQVLVRCHHNKAKAFIEIESIGPQIGHDETKRIFEKFQRGKATRHRSGGVGLGLWLARQSIRAEGGDLHVRLAQAQNRANTFVVEIPLND